MFAKLKSGVYNYEQFKEARFAHAKYASDMMRLDGIRVEIANLESRKNQDGNDKSLINALQSSLNDEANRILSMVEPEKPEILTTEELFEHYKSALNLDPNNKDLFLITQEAYQNKQRMSLSLPFPVSPPPAPQAAPQPTMAQRIATAPAAAPPPAPQRIEKPPMRPTKGEPPVRDENMTQAQRRLAGAEHKLKHCYNYVEIAKNHMINAENAVVKAQSDVEYWTSEVKRGN